MAVLPVALDESEIALLKLSLAQQCMHCAQSTRLARNDETTARVAVEPMHELQGVLRPQRTQDLDDAEAQATAAVNRDSRGLVDHEQALILDDNRLAQALEERPRNTRWCALRLDPHRGNPNLVVELQALRRVGTVAVDA